MFYNGFTLLMQIFAGATMYWVGRYFGFMAGERSMYKTMTSIQQATRNMYQEITKNYERGGGLCLRLFFLRGYMRDPK